MSDFGESTPTGNEASPTDESPSTKALVLSSRLLIAGLIAEALSLLGLHTPAGFIVFAIFGAGLITAGILTYLWSVTSAPG